MIIQIVFCLLRTGIYCKIIYVSEYISNFSEKTVQTEHGTPLKCETQGSAN